MNFNPKDPYPKIVASGAWQTNSFPLHTVPYKDGRPNKEKWIASVFGAFGLLTGFSAQAQEAGSYWLGTQDQNFMNSNNWSAGFQNSSTQNLVINMTKPDLFTPILSDGAVVMANRFVMGQLPNSPGSFLMQGGSKLIANEFDVGLQTGSRVNLQPNIPVSVGNGKSIMTLTGQGTEVKVLSGYSNVGYEYEAMVQVLDGALFSIEGTTAGLHLGEKATGKAQFIVDGANSTLSITNKILNIGMSGEGKLSIGNGARLTNVANLNLATVASGKGVLVVETGSTLENITNMRIAAGEGTIDISGGSSVSITNNLTLGDAANSKATLIVDGANTSLGLATKLISNNLYIGGASGKGSVYLTNNAAIETNVLQIGSTGSANGTLYVGKNSDGSSAGAGQINSAGGLLFMNADATLELAYNQANWNFDTALNSNVLNAGKLVHTSAGQTTLTADNSNFSGSVSIQQGSVKAGSLNALGGNNTTYVVDNGATLNLGAFSSNLKSVNNAGTVKIQSDQNLIVQDYNQNTSGVVELVLGAGAQTSAVLQATNTMNLSGSLKLLGFGDVDSSPAKATDIYINDFVIAELLSASNSITGNFSSITGTPTPSFTLPSYLVNGKVILSTDQKKISIRDFGLAWIDGQQGNATGSFDLAAGTSFEVDVALNNRTDYIGTSFDTGWAGNSLVKSGAGKLLLSNTNLYNGSTTIQEGVLALTDLSRNLQNSPTIYMQGDAGRVATLQLDSAQANITQNLYLAGTNNIIDSDFNLIWQGSITNDPLASQGGGFIKKGLGALTVGDVAYTAGTTVEEGELHFIGDTSLLAGGIQVAADSLVSFSQGASQLNGNMIALAPLNQTAVIVGDGSPSFSLTHDGSRYVGNTEIYDYATLKTNANEISGQFKLRDYGSVEFNSQGTAVAEFQGEFRGGLDSALFKKGTGTLNLEYDHFDVAKLQLDAGSLNFIAAGTDVLIDVSSVEVNGNAVLGIGQGGSRLKVTDTGVGTLGKLILSGTSTLQMTLNLHDSLPEIQVEGATLGGSSLDIQGFSANTGGSFVTAQEVEAESGLVIMQSNQDILGDFNTSGSTTSTLDYLILDSGVSATKKEYVINSMQLRWKSALPSLARGTFALSKNTGFNVDVVLSDRTDLPNFDNWDGQSLLKKGQGVLELSKVNTYTGSTLVEEGGLRLSTPGAIDHSRLVQISGGDGYLELSGKDHHFQQLKTAQGSRVDWNVEGGTPTNNTLTLSMQDASTQSVQHMIAGNLVGTGDLQIGSNSVPVSETASASEVRLQGDLTDYSGVMHLSQGKLIFDGSLNTAGDPLSRNGSWNGKIVASQAGTVVAINHGAIFEGILDTAAASPHVEVGTDSRWILAGPNVMTQVAGVQLAGTIEFGRATSFSLGAYTPKTLVSSGVWQGDGGTVVLNTVFGNESEASSDKLQLLMGATGTTYLQINSLGGSGASSGDGILVVEGGASPSSAGAFVLQSPVVVDGIYNYYLYYQDAAGQGDNWYLRSRNNEVRNAIYGYNALQAATARYDLSTLGTFSQRQGAIRSAGSQAWGRIISTNGDTGKAGYDAFKKYGAQYDYKSYGVQAGSDLYQEEQADGVLTLGVYGGYGRMEADVSNSEGQHASDIQFNAYTLGGYVSYVADSGWYLDSVVQGSAFRSAQSNEFGTQNKISVNGTGVLLSLETGMKVAATEGLTVIPQMQLVHQMTSLNGVQDLYGRVEFDRVNTAYGRVGVQVEQSFGDASDPNKVWLGLNAWNQLGGDAKMTVSGLNPGSAQTQFANQLGGKWGSVELGISGKLSESVSGFATVGFEKGLGSTEASAISGRVGLRIQW